MPNVVLVGVAQLKNQPSGIADAREPLDLLEQAARGALSDAGHADSILRVLDRIVVVRTDSWRYDADVGERLARRIGASSAVCTSTKHGGNQPILQADLAARLIAKGEIRAAMICGGESYASRRRYLAEGISPPWTVSASGVREPALEAARRTLGDREARQANPDSPQTEPQRHGLVSPIRMYPLYENALKASLGLTFAENQAWSGRIYSRMSEVASTHPAAWNPYRRSVEEITSVSPHNRMICFPYPLLMNAYQGVDQAAAVILMSEEVALSLGSSGGPYVWTGAGEHDCDDVAQRIGFDRSPAMSATLTSVLKRADLRVDEIGHLDLYSCFPVVPKLGALILGVGENRSLSVTGGLTSFGGPGNSYALHALATMTQVLREDDSRSSGLVFAQGHYVTGHHALVLSRAPPKRNGLLTCADDAPVEASESIPKPAVNRAPEGRATIETFTAEFDRDGSPAKGWIIGRTLRNERFVAATSEADALLHLVSHTMEPVGKAVEICRAADGTNSFHFI